jgi:hypothetical protein
MRTLLACTLLCIPAASQEYWNRVSGTFGALTPVGENPDPLRPGAAPLLSIDYGHRFSRHGQFDAGVDAAFAERGDRRMNVNIPRIGYRVIVPVWNDRIETHIGFGAGHSFFKPNPSQQVWLIYGQLGANYALDADRRYRAGMNVRWYRDPVGRPVHQWVAIGGELSYSWGR